MSGEQGGKDGSDGQQPPPESKFLPFACLDSLLTNPSRRVHKSAG